MECICQCTIACNSNHIKLLIKHRILSVETILYQVTPREFSQAILQPQQQCSPRQNCTATQCYNHNNNAHWDRTEHPISHRSDMELKENSWNHKEQPELLWVPEIGAMQMFMYFVFSPNWPNLSASSHTHTHTHLSLIHIWRCRRF